MSAAIDMCKAPYLLAKALAEGVQMGLEIVGGSVDTPPMQWPTQDICDAAEADEESELLLVHSRSLWGRLLS